MPKFPTIIFADENPNSPFLISILVKLAPKLISIGYENFFTELSKLTTFEEVVADHSAHIVNCARNEEVYPRLVAEMIEHLQELYDTYANEEKIKSGEHIADIFTQFMRHFYDKLIRRPFTPDYNELVRLLSVLESAKKLEANTTLDFVTKFLRRYLHELIKSDAQTSEAIIQLFNILDHLEVNFRGITDLEKCINKNLTAHASQELMEDHYENAHEQLSKNVKYMVDQHLQANTPVFAVNSLVNMIVMQKQLVENLPQDVAQANFNFFYICSLDEEPSPENMPPEQVDTIRNLRAGKIDLPLGVTMISASGKTAEAVADEVFMRIMEKIGKYQALPASVRQLPDYSAVGQVKNAAIQVYSMFGFAYQAVMGEPKKSYLVKDVQEDNIPRYK